MSWMFATCLQASQASFGDLCPRGCADWVSEGTSHRVHAEGLHVVHQTTPVESVAPRRYEALRQRGQLPCDVQELRFRPVWTDELDTDGKCILRSAERHHECRMAARVERSNVGPAVVVVDPQHAIEIERAALLAALERRTIRDRREQHIVVAEEVLDVLGQHTLEA